MKPRIDHYPPGYDPTADKIPPRQVKLAPLVGCGLIVLLICFVAGAILSRLLKPSSSSMAINPTGELTPEITLDAWGATGTALYWITQSPTLTATESATPTAELTPELTEESTSEVTPDAWQATGTAIYLTLSSLWTATPTLKPAPSSLSAQAAATFKPSSVTTGGMPSSSSAYMTEVYNSQHPPAQPTARPPVVITVQVIVTATARPTRAPSITPTPTPTNTLFPTYTATMSPTATESPTASPTASATPTPTETPTEAPTATNTLFPTYTATFTLTPTETPTEAQIPTNTPEEITP